MMVLLTFSLLAKQNLLAISWQNAFCEMNKYKKECKNMDSKDFGASNFVLHGLWPQPRIIFIVM